LTFLGRAKKFFQDLGSEPESKVQFYNVLCASGHRVRGERTEGYQALRCPVCGEGVFVLPRSPLPDPIAPARPSSRPRPAIVDEGWPDEGPVELSDPAIVAVDVAGTEPMAADAEIVWEDPPAEATDRRGSAPASQVKSKVDDKEEPGPGSVDGDSNTATREPESVASGRPRGRPKQKGPIAATPGTRPARNDDPIVADRDRKGRARKPSVANPTGRGQTRDRPAAALTGPIPAPRKRRRYPLILWGVPVLVVATVGFRSWQQKRQEYPLIAEKGRIEGIPALEEGKFDKAYQLLSAAKSAVDSLSGDVEGAEAIRNAADEAAIFINLSSNTLEEMLEEAGHTNPDVWATRFDNLYKNRSIIIDSWIATAPEPGNGAYDIQYRVFPSGGVSQFSDSKNVVSPERIGFIDLTDFQLLELTRPRVDDRVIFGARLASFQYDSSREEWVIRLVPKSGIVIQHTKALEALHWPKVTSRDLNAEDPP
jgi:hypothetical protein